MVKNGYFFSSNGRIHTQIIKFQFKRTNHEPPHHYCPLTPMADGSVNGTARLSSSAGGTDRPGQVSAPPPSTAITSSRAAIVPTPA
jgi:hypothetical protein